METMTSAHVSPYAAGVTSATQLDIVPHPLDSGVRSLHGVYRVYDRDMETVREMRDRAGLTQTDLARQTGLSQPNISAYEAGRRTPTSGTLEKIRQATGPRPTAALATHRADVARIARAHKAVDVRVFGSVSRGEDQPGSDLDLLVDFDEGASLLDLVGLGDQLEALLGVPVDVISSGGLRGKAGERIRQMAVPL